MTRGSLLLLLATGCAAPAPRPTPPPPLADFKCEGKCTYRDGKLEGPVTVVPTGYSRYWYKLETTFVAGEPTGPGRFFYSPFGTSELGEAIVTTSSYERALHYSFLPMPGPGSVIELLDRTIRPGPGTDISRYGVASGPVVIEFKSHPLYARFDGTMQRFHGLGDGTVTRRDGTTLHGTFSLEQKNVQPVDEAPRVSAVPSAGADNAAVLKASRIAGELDAVWRQLKADAPGAVVYETTADRSCWTGFTIPGPGSRRLVVIAFHREQLHDPAGYIEAGGRKADWHITQSGNVAVWGLQIEADAPDAMLNFYHRGTDERCNARMMVIRKP